MTAWGFGPAPHNYQREAVVNAIARAEADKTVDIEETFCVYFRR